MPIRYIWILIGLLFIASCNSQEGGGSALIELNPDLLIDLNKSI